jgi:hypothetical protein
VAGRASAAARGSPGGTKETVGVGRTLDALLLRSDRRTRAVARRQARAKPSPPKRPSETPQRQPDGRLRNDSGVPPRRQLGVGTRASRGPTTSAASNSALTFGWRCLSLRGARVDRARGSGMPGTGLGVLLASARDDQAGLQRMRSRRRRQRSRTAQTCVSAFSVGSWSRGSCRRLVAKAATRSAPLS